MRRMFLVGLLVVAGCAKGDPPGNPLSDKLEAGTRAGGSKGDPLNDTLEAGAQAVVALDPVVDTEFVIFQPNGKKPDAVLGVVVPEKMPPGVRVTVGNDAGFLERTQANIDEDIKLYTRIEDASAVKRYQSEKPAKYFPPDSLAKSRKVDVVVESGEHKGRAGKIRRGSLRPVSP